MKYTIDGSSCVKGGTYTLTTASSNVLGQTYNTYTLGSGKWSDNGVTSSENLYLENTGAAFSNMLSANQATKAWCTVPHTITSTLISNMAYTVTAPSIESPQLNIFDSGCSD